MSKGTIDREYGNGVDRMFHPLVTVPTSEKRIRLIPIQVILLDCAELAKELYLSVKTQTPKRSSSYYRNLKQTLEGCGATLTENIQDEALTHVIISEDDPSRAVQLRKLT